MNRRDFVRIAAGTAASAGRVRGANDRLRVGLIGCGGRGAFVAQLMRGPDAEIAALCDVWESRLAAAKGWAPGARTFSDFRALLADKDIDAVIIATPDHWHARMLILACEAGRDVYLEKPVMHRLGEAKAMIEAVRRSKRIVQVGTQHRSSGHIAEAARIVQSGQIGEVRLVRVWDYLRRPGQPRVPDSEPPAGLDWDAWLGPAPKVPFNSARLDFRSFMDYNNGIISDYGTHRFDTVHQIMGVDAPRKVSSSGMRFDKRHAGDILDLQQATCEYPGFVLSCEACAYNGHGVGGRTPGMRYHGMQGTEDRPHGIAFYGTEAALFVDRIELEVYPEPGRGAAMHRNEDEPTPRHARQFVENVRARKEPFANIETGARASAVACIANVAFLTGRKLTWDAESWSFPGDQEANLRL